MLIGKNGGTIYFRLGQSKYFAKSITTISGGLKYYIQPGQATVTVTFNWGKSINGVPFAEVHKIECSYGGLSQEMSACSFISFAKLRNGSTYTESTFTKSNGLYLTSNESSKSLTLRQRFSAVYSDEYTTINANFSVTVFGKSYSTGDISFGLFRSSL